MSTNSVGNRDAWKAAFKASRWEEGCFLEPYYPTSDWLTAAAILLYSHWEQDSVGQSSADGAWTTCGIKTKSVLKNSNWGQVRLFHLDKHSILGELTRFFLSLDSFYNSCPAGVRLDDSALSSFSWQNITSMFIFLKEPCIERDSWMTCLLLMIRITRYHILSLRCLSDLIASK